jgi:hypothetical protein
MNDRNLLRSLFLIAIALVFGLGALRYPIGQFSHAGPGLFPLLVSALLLAIGLISLARSRYEERLQLDFKMKNIAVILLSLCGFAVVSKFVNMTAGIVFMVSCASMAGSGYSVARNVKIAACLIAIAFGFQRLLGLNLPLY